MGFIRSQLFTTPPLPTRSFKHEICIVTGGNTGLGKEAVRHLVRLGAAKVIIASRNVNAGEAAKLDILSTNTSSSIEVWALDLSSFSSIKTFADRARSLPRLDVLIENAGVIRTSFSLEEGHESTITVNVLGTFLLLFSLLPVLRSSAEKTRSTPRITIVTSDVHAWPKFPERNAPEILKALDDPRNSSFNERYDVSKLLQVLLVRTLAPKLTRSGVCLNMTNPGLCRTSLSREMKFSKSVAFAIKLRVFGRNVEVGSRTLVLAVSEDLSGTYFSDGLPMDEAVGQFARSEEGGETGERVWGEVKGILGGVDAGLRLDF